MFRTALLLIIASFWTAPCLAQQAPATGGAAALTPARQVQLVRMVRQDCGSCHGIQLTGGLGPELTRERMVEIPLDSLFSVIYHGRPGTPMPGWKTMISEADAHWIAHQLQAGFPLEAGKSAP